MAEIAVMLFLLSLLQTVASSLHKTLRKDVRNKAYCASPKETSLSVRDFRAPLGLHVAFACIRVKMRLFSLIPLSLRYKMPETFP